jgi:hypothetical protein
VHILDGVCKIVGGIVNAPAGVNKAGSAAVCGGKATCLRQRHG